MTIKMIDLSHLIHGDMPVYPGAPRPLFEQLTRVESEGFRVARATMNYHVGTHVDAPAHMLTDGATLDEFPVEHFRGRAVMLDVSGGTSLTISLAELKRQEFLIRQAEFLILHTGWSRYWGQEKYFQEYPVLSEDAARWLTEFPLKGIGMDCVSADPVTSQDYAIHKIFLGKKILLVENLTNLAAVGDGFFEFFCLPLPIQQADASSVRAVAVLRSKRGLGGGS